MRQSQEASLLRPCPDTHLEDLDDDPLVVGDVDGLEDLAVLAAPQLAHQLVVVLVAAGTENTESRAAEGLQPCPGPPLPARPAASPAPPAPHRGTPGRDPFPGLHVGRGGPAAGAGDPAGRFTPSSGRALRSPSTRGSSGCSPRRTPAPGCRRPGRAWRRRAAAAGGGGGRGAGAGGRRGGARRAGGRRRAAAGPGRAGRGRPGAAGAELSRGRGPVPAAAAWAGPERRAADPETAPRVRAAAAARGVRHGAPRRRGGPPAAPPPPGG